MRLFCSISTPIACYRFLAVIIIALSFAISTSTAFSQYTTPVVDANFDGVGVYPNNYISGTTTWYMTWNATDLFVFVQNANETEPVSIYLDVDPIIPVNGGTDADGTLVGLNYDGYTTRPNLPFRADICIYAHRTAFRSGKARRRGPWPCCRPWVVILEERLW